MIYDLYHHALIYEKEYTCDLFIRSIRHLLYPACGAPRNVFDLLAYRVLGANSDESARADFALERVKGERKARALSQVEEITLEVFTFVVTSWR